MDATSAAFEEVAGGDAGSSDVPPIERFQKTRSRVLRACAKVPNLDSVSKIAIAAGGRKSETLAVAKALVDDGDLVFVGEGYRPKISVPGQNHASDGV
jgi:hypothetical protein